MDIEVTKVALCLLSGQHNGQSLRPVGTSDSQLIQRSIQDRIVQKEQRKQPSILGRCTHLPLTTLRVWVRRLRGPGGVAPLLDLGWHDFAWSPDGSELASSSFVPDPDQKWHTTHAVFNIKTGEKKPLPFPPSHVLQDWSRDGRYFLMTEFDLSEARPATMRLVPTRLVLLNRDGTESMSLQGVNKNVGFARLSPDGRKVLYTTQGPPAKDSPGAWMEAIAVVDIATKVSAPVADVPLNGRRFRTCWSPDGKRIAYSWMPKFEGKPEDAEGHEFESVLVTCDPDGKNLKTIATGKGPLQGITLDLLDWR